MKLKILPLSMRRKKRYIGFIVLSEEKIELTDLESAITQSLLDMYGSKGFAELWYKFLKDTWDGKRGIIRCAHTKTEDVIAGIGAIERIGDSRVNFKILKVSGTIKKIKASFDNNQ